MAGLMLPEPARAAYAAALDSLLPTLPAAARESRAAHLARFIQSGFPSTREEDWRYTDLSALADRVFAPAPAASRADPAPYALPGTWRMVFINGNFQPEASDYPAGAIRRRADGPAPADGSDADGISQLNTALALDGAVLQLGRGQALDRPLHVLSITAPGATPAMSHLAHAVDLEPGASATVIFEDVTLGEGAHFLTQCTRLRAVDNAQLDVVRLQDHGPGVQALTRWDASVGRDATLAWMNLDLGGALVRNDLCVDLAAPNATLDLSGVFIAAGSTHVDNHTRIDHSWPHGTSRQTYRGIAGDAARAVFNGKVVVHPKAVRTDSNLQTASLLLSPQAQINAKPELQIDNDDVKCAHGATCGQLDAQALYYLRSRGLPLAAAREVLLYGFANAIVGQVRQPVARKRLRERLISRFPAGAAVEALA